MEPWNDPRNTGAAPAISNAQTITVTSAPPIDWQARATAAEAREAKLREALQVIEAYLYATAFGSNEHQIANAALQETTDVG